MSEHTMNYTVLCVHCKFESSDQIKNIRLKLLSTFIFVPTWYPCCKLVGCGAGMCNLQSTMCNVQWARKVQCEWCNLHLSTLCCSGSNGLVRGDKRRARQEVAPLTSITRPPRAIAQLCKLCIVKILWAESRRELRSSRSSSSAIETSALVADTNNPSFTPLQLPASPVLSPCPLEGGRRGLSPALADTPHLAQSPLKLVQLHAKGVKMSVGVGIFVGLWWWWWLMVTVTIHL